MGAMGVIRAMGVLRAMWLIGGGLAAVGVMRVMGIWGAMRLVWGTTCGGLTETGRSKCSCNAEKEHCAKQKEELNEKSIKKHNLGFKDSTLQR